MSEPGFDAAGQRIDPAVVNGWITNGRCTGKARPAAKAGQFVKAPLPWLARAGALPGKALSVGLALWFLRGVKKKTTVRLTGETLAKFGVERKPGYRGLSHLEIAGLVRVARKRGRGPLVTILDAVPSADA